MDRTERGAPCSELTAMPVASDALLVRRIGEAYW